MHFTDTNIPKGDVGISKSDTALHSSRKKKERKQEPSESQITNHPNEE